MKGKKNGPTKSRAGRIEAASRSREAHAAHQHITQPGLPWRAARGRTRSGQRSRRTRSSRTRSPAHSPSSRRHSGPSPSASAAGSGSWRRGERSRAAVVVSALMVKVTTCAGEQAPRETQCVPGLVDANLDHKLINAANKVAERLVGNSALQCTKHV